MSDNSESPINWHSKFWQDYYKMWLNSYNEFIKFNTAVWEEWDKTYDSYRKKWFNLE